MNRDRAIEVMTWVPLAHSRTNRRRFFSDCTCGVTSISVIGWAEHVANAVLDALLDAGMSFAEPPSLGAVWTDADGRRWREVEATA